MRRLRLIGCILLPSTLLACKCQMSLSVCHEFAMSSVVFIGTVESVTPRFLDKWNAAGRPSLPALNAAEARYQKNPSAAALRDWKDTFRTAFPDLTPDYQKRLQSASSPAQLSSLFSSVLDRGKQVRFRVKTVFRNGGDDDKDKSDDKEDKPSVFEVWTPFDDCGYDFQEGETYLVFADDDEETNIMETSRCSRTNRLTDAGADLAYLYFLQNSADASARFEGFVTRNPFYQLEQDMLHDPEKVTLPVPDAVLQLSRGGSSRFAVTDANGRFVFDGLTAGDYQVTAYESGFPEKVRALMPVSKVRVETKGCASRTFLVGK